MEYMQREIRGDSAFERGTIAKWRLRSCLRDRALQTLGCRAIREVKPGEIVSLA